MTVAKQLAITFDGLNSNRYRITTQIELNGKSSPCIQMDTKTGFKLIFRFMSVEDAYFCRLQT